MPRCNSEKAHLLSCRKSQTPSASHPGEGITWRALCLYCHFHLCRPPAPDDYFIVIIDCYMLTIGLTGHMCIFGLPLFTFQMLWYCLTLRTLWVSKYRFKQNHRPVMSPMIEKQVSVPIHVFALLFAVKQAVPAAVTQAFSQMKKFRQGNFLSAVRIIQPAVKFEQNFAHFESNESVRFCSNGLFAGQPGDSNKTLSCRVNERWSLC